MAEKLRHQPSAYGQLYDFFKNHRMYRLAAETIAFVKSPNATDREDVKATDELLQAATRTSESTKKRLALNIRRRAASGFQVAQAHTGAFSGTSLDDPNLRAAQKQEADKNSEEIKKIKAGTYTPWK